MVAGHGAHARGKLQELGAENSTWWPSMLHLLVTILESQVCRTVHDQHEGGPQQTREDEVMPPHSVLHMLVPISKSQGQHVVTVHAADAGGHLRD